jgi:hypothetical protein
MENGICITETQVPADSISELDTPRGQAFFWAGLSILPVFWTWWMTPRHFHKRDILVARMWTLLYVLVVILLRDAVVSKALAALWSYELVAYRIAQVLAFWFLFRAFGFPRVIFPLFLLIDTIAILTSVANDILQKHTLGAWFLLLPLLLAVLHCLLKPMSLWRERQLGEPQPCPRLPSRRRQGWE